MSKIQEQPNIPNEFHRIIKYRGGRIHKKKKGEIPRKLKYKNKDLE